VCCLLSGGLDSTIIATVAKRESETAAQWTYCAGARAPGGTLDDFYYSREVAGALGSTHIEAEVTGPIFLDRWAWMVNGTGVPLSTPNEVAIYEVAHRLRADGKVVALSGEGADELFGGYDAVMDDAARRFAALAGCHSGEWRSRGGTIMLESSAWVPAGAKEGILSEPALAASENDGHLSEYCYDQFRRLAEQREATDPMQVALMFQRRINLEGLLRRLDSATMLASVEGRTPFADQNVARLAEALSLSSKYSPGSNPKGKVVLRRAFSSDIPASVLTRPKASFPLPFQEWGQRAAAVLDSSSFARDVFTEPLRLVLGKQAWTTQGLWRIGWPAVNLAIWGKRWWG
jgi:asparagine synthase (glutamine-hydrolysing)